MKKWNAPSIDELSFVNTENGKKGYVVECKAILVSDHGYNTGLPDTEGFVRASRTGTNGQCPICFHS